jgi:hypothetical protein
MGKNTGVMNIKKGYIILLMLFLTSVCQGQTFADSALVYAQFKRDVMSLTIPVVKEVNTGDKIIYEPAIVLLGTFIINNEIKDARARGIIFIAGGTAAFIVYLRIRNKQNRYVRYNINY